MQSFMSRRDNCYGNAPIESFWGALKTDPTFHQRYQAREEAMRDIQEYIEIFYNRQRRQKKLGYLFPAAYERRFYQLQKAA
jgi:transposase InsO family protein